MYRRAALAGLFLAAAIGSFAADAVAQERRPLRPAVRIAPGIGGPWVMEFAAPSPSGVVLAARTPDGPAAMSAAALAVRGAPAARTVDPRQAIDPQFLPQTVAYAGAGKPGTIVIDPHAHFLYLVGENGTARRYGVGTGKPGFGWSGTHRISRKAEWPGWTPPSQMIARERKKGRILPAHMEGGPANPLGARAMYLGSTLYRIHGTNQPWTIGRNVSSGCIRMRNEDVTDLYERVSVGTEVLVL
ncbi:L,D-transpeptidase [Jiella sonneratiae]|uniref:L,D-transpeptidase n=1 Tax=Jiella sonneratiae TaxID=2816856 RepID=A0ABS3J8D1_9HYPH|nr:L,D-transpeptidase [Jiella sonneratiae]MBO0905928.1 L,D-transpeptidase [Jiella sonneratiae]